MRKVVLYQLLSLAAPPHDTGGPTVSGRQESPRIGRV